MSLFSDLLRSPKLRREIINRIRNFKYERLPNGEIYVPHAKILFGGMFAADHYRGGDLLGSTATDNVVVNEGLNHILDVTFSAATQLTSWYIGIFEGDVTPGATVTASNVASTLTELTGDYDEATRQAWTEGGPSSQSITNSANKATFTIATDSTTIYGAFLISDNTKGGTTGTLAAAGRFASAREANDDDEVLVTYTLTAQDA